MFVDVVTHFWFFGCILLLRRCSVGAGTKFADLLQIQATVCQLVSCTWFLHFCRSASCLCAPSIWHLTRKISCRRDGRRIARCEVLDSRYHRGRGYCVRAAFKLWSQLNAHSVFGVQMYRMLWRFSYLLVGGSIPVLLFNFGALCQVHVRSQHIRVLLL